jgi:hypothetical protein
MSTFDGGTVESGRMVKQPGLMVVLGGLVTTAIALALVALVGYATDGEFNLMGFFIWYIVPLSAIGVGFVGGIGYSIVSWLRGIRVAGVLLAAVLLLMIVGYFGAHYAQYRVLDPRWEDGSKVGYWTYFDFETRMITFTDTDSSSRNKKEPEPLGAWGYGVRAVEVAGFSLGGLIPLLILRTRPFCEACQRYMKTQALCTIPAAPAVGKALRKKTADDVAAAMEQSTVAERAAATLEQITRAVVTGDVAAFAEIVEPLKAHSKEAAKRLKRIEVRLCHCPTCSAGYFRVVAAAGKGDKTNREDLTPIPAEAEFLHQVVQIRQASRVHV